jgi:hypothetical protein
MLTVVDGAGSVLAETRLTLFASAKRELSNGRSYRRSDKRERRDSQI